MISSYQELYEGSRVKTDHLLIGNGFSINIWNDFNYTSLYENQKKTFQSEDLELFEELKTTNFEFVLENIKKAISINNIFNNESDKLAKSYERIKSALINGVVNVHPDNFEVQLNNSLNNNFTLRTFNKSIFTTNYDLIPYWLHIKLLEQNKKNNDFFKYNGKKYLHFVPQINQGTLNLFYLHGGLHLFVNDENEIQKVKKESHEFLIDAVIDSMENNNIPLYISEGNWMGKLEQIESNRYLRFCYDSLMNIEGDLTIFGHSLSESADKHIVDAINASDIKVIAYGIHDLERKEVIMETIKNYFNSKEIYFFNSHSFDQSIKNLNVQLIWGEV